MDPTALAKLFELGPWGVAAAACAWATYCHRGWVSSLTSGRAEIVKLATEATAALHTSATTLAERTQAVKDLAASHLEMATAIRSMTATNNVHVERIFDKLDATLSEARRLAQDGERARDRRL